MNWDRTGAESEESGNFDEDEENEYMEEVDKDQDEDKALDDEVRTWMKRYGRHNVME